MHAARLIVVATMLLVGLCSCGTEVLVGPGSEAGAGAGGSGASGSGASGAGASGAAGATGTGASGATGAAGTGASGATGTGGAGGAAMICDDLGDPCTECAAEHCPEIWCGCTTTPSCFELFDCFSSCLGASPCEQQCLQAYPDAISNVVLVSGCAGTVCSDSCTWGNPDFDECSECAYTDCADEMNACLATPPCTALWNCFHDCDHLDLVCQQQCYDAYPGGVVLLQAAWQCIDTQCPEC